VRRRIEQNGMKDARGSTRPSLLASLIALVAAGIGLASGWFLRGSDTSLGSAMDPPVAHAADGVTREEFEIAKSEILAQLHTLARPAATGASSATAPGSQQVNELGRRLDELDARVALLSSGVRPGFGGRSWANARGAGSESIEKIGARIQTSCALAQKDQPHEDMESALSREHYLWMLEDVVRAYGPPEHIETSNGLALFYGRFTIEGTNEPCFVEFTITEGFVTQVGYDCRDGW
jgi:hypothetical protein